MIHFDEKNAWIAVFDIVGFKNRIKIAETSENMEYIFSQINEIYDSVNKEIAVHGDLTILTFADTFIVYTSDSSSSSFPWFILYCTQLIEYSIEVELPLRGAISAGRIFVSKNPPVLLGTGFIEAYEYAECQDWIGLLLTPSATLKLRSDRIEPLNNDFVDNDIPLRKKERANVLAYRFQNGGDSISSHLIGHLESMKNNSPDDCKKKYENTINFINKYYIYI